MGYFDFTPDLYASGKVVYHKLAPNSDKYVLPSFADINIFDPTVSHSISICVSNAINLQLGSRVRFIGPDLIVLNNIENGKQITEIWDTKNIVRVKTFNLPFWNWNESKRFFVGLNFANLHNNRPGYGYQGEHRFLNEEVLYSVDLDSGKEYVVNANDVSVYLGLKENANFYFNHVTFNPSNDQFISILIWDINGVRYLAPFLTDKTFSFFKRIDCDNYFSHHCWLDFDLLLVYARLKGKKNPEWLLWNAESGWKETHKSFQLEDGHPTYSFKTKRLFIDSYPDRYGRMKIYQYDNLKLISKKIIAFSNPRFFGAVRCDLHPRISNNGKDLYCDVPKFNSRKLEVFSVDKLFVK
jgi:hypothetical protein